MELLVKPEMLTSYKYGPTFGNAETVFFFRPCIFIIEGRTDQRNAQINFSFINLLLFKLLRHVSATQLEPSSGSPKSLQVTSHCNLEHVISLV